MNNREFFEFLHKLHKDEIELAKAKTSDYGDAQGNNIFSTVDTIALFTKTHRNYVIAVFLAKHVVAIMNALSKDPDKPSCTAEKLLDKIRDARAFLNMLEASLFVEPKKQLTAADANFSGCDLSYCQSPFRQAIDNMLEEEKNNG